MISIQHVSKWFGSLKALDDVSFEIKRGEEIVGKGQVLELQQNKIKSREVLRGSEFGSSVKTSAKIEAGDVLVLFEETIRKKTL